MEKEGSTKARHSNKNQQCANFKKKDEDSQHTLLSDRHPGEDHGWCGPGEFGPAPAVASCLFPRFKGKVARVSVCLCVCMCVLEFCR